MVRAYNTTTQEAEKDQKFKISFSYIVSLRLALAIWDPISKQTNKTISSARMETLHICSVQSSAGRHTCLRGIYIVMVKKLEFFGFI